MKTSLRLITPPTVEPVSVETAKAFLRVDHSAEDNLITALVKGARETCEELSRRAFTTQTWEMVLDAFPSTRCLEVWRPVLQAVNAITYYDTTDALQPFTDYTVDADSDPGMIVFNSLPAVSTNISGGVVINFDAGFGGAAADVPQRFKDAILSLTMYRYENRDAVAVPTCIKQAMIGERSIWLV